MAPEMLSHTPLASQHGARQRRGSTSHVFWEGFSAEHLSGWARALRERRGRSVGQVEGDAGGRCAPGWFCSGAEVPCEDGLL